ncbi:MAG: metallophosphoesterase [Candidatus Solibacter sp.]
MRRRTFLLGTVAMAAPPPDPQDDWQGIRRIVAVGDVHGDKDAFVAVLKMARVIDEDERWIAEATHLVQVGDVPGRGPQTRQAYDLMMRLEKEAASAGGKFHALIGNHDAGVIYGDLRNTHPDEYGAFRAPDSEVRLQEALEAELEARRKRSTVPPTAADTEGAKTQWLAEHSPGFVEHREAFGPSGPYGSWIRGHNSIIRINDTLYLHGGISPKYVARGRTALNNSIRRELADPERLLPGVVTDPEGPLRYRGLVEEAGPALEPHLLRVLRFHGVRRMVIGHTVTQTAIRPLFGGRVVNIDIGLSRFYGRPPACLVLESGGVHVLHRGTSIPLPGPGRAAELAYLRAVEAADVQPSPVTKLIETLQGAK